METTTIDQLDPQSLSNIFKSLSNQDIWYAGLLCPQLRLARLQTATTRHELALLIGKDAKHYIDESGLRIPKRGELVDENGDVMFPDNDQSVQLQIYSFPLDFVRLLLDNFDHLTTLTISTRVNCKDIDSIIHLLEQFNRQDGTLFTLKIYSNYDQDRSNQDGQNKIRNVRTNIRLLSAVNSIGSLRMLTFDVNAEFARNSKYPRIYLPILAQLEEFEFNTADKFVCLHDSITRFAVNNQRLRRIAINNRKCDLYWLRYRLPIEFAARFNHLRLDIRLNPLRFDVEEGDNYSGFVYRDLCERFVNITSLEYSFKGHRPHLFEMFFPLRLLPNLLSLVFNIEGNDFENIIINGIPVALLSVQVFVLNITSSRNVGHRFFDRFNMFHMLPNVQVVRVIREEALCSDCEPKRKWYLSNKEKIVQLEEYCAGQIFRREPHYWLELRIGSVKVVCNSESSVPSNRESSVREWTRDQLNLLPRHIPPILPSLPPPPPPIAEPQNNEIHNYSPIRIDDQSLNDNSVGDDEDESDYELDELRRYELEELNQELFGDSVEVEN